MAFRLPALHIYWDVVVLSRTWSHLSVPGTFLGKLERSAFWKQRTNKQTKKKWWSVPDRKPLTTTPQDTQLLPSLCLEIIPSVSLSPLLKIRKCFSSKKRNKESPAASLPKNRSSGSVNYKEDILASKQRRGDSYIGLCFLNSIFKKKKEDSKQNFKKKVQWSYLLDAIEIHPT